MDVHVMKKFVQLAVCVKIFCCCFLVCLHISGNEEF